MNHPNLRFLAVCAALSVPALASAPAFAQAAVTPPVAAGTPGTPTNPPVTVGGGPGSPVIDADTLARQRQLFDQANQAYDQGRLADAEVAYLAAWKLKKSFDVAGNIGNLEADLKKWRTAGEFLSYAIREFPAGGKPGLRENLLKRLADAQKQVGQLRIHVDRPGAEVFLDGVSVGLAPIADELYVEPGAHQIEARLEGFPPALVSTQVGKGDSADVAVKLVAKRANRGVLIAGGAIAGVAVVAGAVFTGLSFGEASTAKSKYAAVPGTGCPATPPSTGTCADLKGALDSKNLYANVALYSFVGAGVVGLATVVYGLTSGSRPARSGLVVAPVVTAQGGGVFVGGSF